MNISGKTVLITGANRGIGRELVSEALKRGAAKIFAGTRTADAGNADARVISVTLDITDESQIRRAAAQIDALDLLVNNAGVAAYDDLNDLDKIEQHLAVNLFGTLKVTRAFLPLLTRSRGAVVNNMSVAALAALPMIPAYSLSKAALANATQSLRAMVASQGVSVHGVFLGPIDTEMSRGLEVPKASPEAAAVGIFDGLERREDDIFPDPMAQLMAAGYRAGVVKSFERQFAAFAPGNAAAAA